MQWHPIFAKMLRPLVQDYYEVVIGLPVGDAPRIADIVLLRRTSDQPLPFRGLWHHLTTWNILEFKGRTVSARVHDLDLLVELGLGIARRLNEERARQRERAVAPAEVSFWYITNHFGRRFLREAGDVLGPIAEASPGIWRCQVMRRSLFLVDGRTVPVDRESVPLHLAGEESPVIESALARVIVDEPGFWELYGPLLGVLHPNIIEEANRMATSKRKSRGLDLRPFINYVGLEKFLEAIELRELMTTVGPKRVVKEMGVEWLFSQPNAEDANGSKNYSSKRNTARSQILVPLRLFHYRHLSSGVTVCCLRVNPCGR